MNGYRWGGVVTLVAVACAAFLVADVAHEGLGHGGACLALGGHVNLLSTTYEDCSIRGRLIDGAGPMTGIVFAVLAGAWLWFAPPRGPNARIFLSLVVAFAGFWNVGYMIKSGLLDSGDWAFVIAGLRPAMAWHAGLTVLGIALYALTMRIFATLAETRLASRDASSPKVLSFALTAYVAAGLLSAAGAVFDPRGSGTIWTDALPSSLGAIGLVWAAYSLGRRMPELRIASPVSPAWIATGSVAASLFVAVLGPGLRF